MARLDKAEGAALLERFRQPRPRVTDGIVLEHVDDDGAVRQRTVGVGLERITGTKYSRHARVDTGRRAASLHQETLADEVVERQPAIDASGKHQAAKFIRTDHAIAGLETCANLGHALRGDCRSRRIE